MRVLLPDGRNVQYGYAPTGERISRRNARGIVYFVHNGLDVATELGEDLKPLATYIQGPGIDWPLAVTRGEKRITFTPTGSGASAG